MPAPLTVTAGLLPPSSGLQLPVEGIGDPPADEEDTSAGTRRGMFIKMAVSPPGVVDTPTVPPCSSTILLVARRLMPCRSCGRRC